MKETIEIELSDVDVRYGIIKISKHKDFFENSTSPIVLVCKEKEYYKKIPTHGSYISGLTKLHRANSAKEGTKVEITKCGTKYNLNYSSNGSPSAPDKAFNSLENIILDIRILVKENTWAFYRNEANVRTEIIDPILRQLGWNFPFDIFREANTRNGGNVDYALRKENNFKIVIEAKSIEVHSDDKWVKDRESKNRWMEAQEQLKKYIGKNSRFQGCVGILTNGISWQFNVEDSIYTIDIFNNRFIDFIENFKYDSFDKKKLNEVLKKEFENNKSSESPLISHEIHLMGEDGQFVKEKNFSKIYEGFVKSNKEHIIELVNDETFGVNVLERKNFENDKEYVNTYSDTFQKEMIIQQIIRELDNQGQPIKYSIEIIQDNNC